MRKILALTLAVGLAFPAASALADTTALTFTGGTAYGFVTDPRPNTVGWVFTLGSAVTLTQLGFYDMNGDGLATSHQVGVWDSSQTLLASATLDSSDPLQAGFRWSAVAPVSLAAGAYRIGALVSDDDWYYSSADSVLTASPVTYGGGAYSLGSFAYPSEMSFTAMGRFGPNFQFTTTAVPEPSAYLLMISGLGLVAGLQRRRRPTAR